MAIVYSWHDKAAVSGSTGMQCMSHPQKDRERQRETRDMDLTNFSTELTTSRVSISVCQEYYYTELTNSIIIQHSVLLLLKSSTQPSERGLHEIA